MASADDPGQAAVPRRPDPPPGTAFRAVARVRSVHGGRIYTARDRDSGAGRGVAPVPTNREETRPLTPPPPPVRPVFVDDSGRRGRLLAVTAVSVAIIALLLVVAFWIGLATTSGGA
jgi:hypothetical protein